MAKVWLMKQVFLPLVLGIACVGVAELSLSNNASAGQQQEAGDSPPDNGRLLADQVDLENVEAFKAQVRRDLSVGTTRTEVENYLTRWSVPYDFFDSKYGALGNSFHGVIEDLGMYYGFTAKLNIWVYLDNKNTVRETTFRITYL